MSQVLYRKWRPQRFDQVVGQGAVTRTLRNAVSRGRAAHAYLFCGPRGTGKTSTARILAKTVNCLSPSEGEPDNECDICVSFNEGRALDLIEIDAASNRGIDDMRNLRDKIQFSPNEARYKVYIVDEVHMLTEPAFNALLKTLEEPPEHAIFVLATTEAHKVPLTIISRCQRFDFRRVPLETAVERLGRLCKEEGVQAEDEALTLLARAAGGSLRDAENLLERAIVSYGQTLSEAQVRDLLELHSDERTLELVEHIVKRSIPEALTVINEVADQGGDLRQFHRAVTEYIREAMLVKARAGASSSYPDEVAVRLRALADETTLEYLVGALRLFIQADARRDDLSSLSMEMAVVQAGLDPEPAVPTSPTPEPSPARRAAAPPARRAPASRPDRAVAPAPQRTAPQPPQPTTPAELPDDPAGRLEVQWNTILRSLARSKGKRFNLGALLRSSSERAVADGVVTLRYSHQSHMERMQEELDDPQTRRIVKEALTSAMDGPYDLEVAAIDSGGNGPAQKASRRSHLVRALQGMGARVVSESEEELEQEHVAPGPEAPETDGQAPGGA